MWSMGETFNPRVCVCDVADETIAQIVSECSKIAQKEYKKVRHDNIAKMIHWKLHEKMGIQ